MSTDRQLNNPILIAAWPGMGQVALTACYYLIAKLKMDFRIEYASSELFDVDHVTVEAGLIQPFRYPKNQFFVWNDPQGENDILVFIGEAQPPQGRYDFCRKLVDFATREGVAKIYTFAAMVTGSELMDKSNVVGAATDKETFHGFLENEIGLLRSGRISGMNGVLLGVAAERKIPGGCLLGELPAMFAAIPYPKASVSVLEALSRLTKIEIDMSELNLEVKKMEAYLSNAMEQMKRLAQEDSDSLMTDGDEEYKPDPGDNGRLSSEEQELIESLFDQAREDRSRAFELKRELDRLGVFSEYENRFLDLFKQDGG